MTKLYRFIKFKTKFLALLILVLVALYVIAGRYVLYVLPEKRQQLESFLSEQISHPVTIESLSAKWVGFDPVVTLKNITVNGGENARIGRVSVRVAILRSLQAWSPRFQSIQLIDSHLSIKQFRKGELSIAGMSLITETGGGGGESDELEAIVRMLDGAEINLFDNSVFFSHYPDRSAEAKTRLWHFPDVSMSYRGDEIFAKGQMLQPDGESTALNFALNGQGVLSDELVNGTLFLEARSSEFLDELLKVYEWQDMSIQSLDASSRAWLNFNGLTLDSVKGDIQVSQLNWKIKEKSLPPLLNVAGQFHLQNTENSQQITLSGFGFNWAGQACEPSNVRIDIASSKLQVYADKLDLNCVSDIGASTGWMSASLQDRLEVSQPEGALVNAFYVQEEGQDFAFEAELADVSLSAYFGTPMGRGIDGHIEVNPDGGSVTFQSDHFGLGFPNLFLDPWATSWAEGKVSWRSSSEEETEVFSEGLRLYFEDESFVYGDFILRINPDDREDYLALSIAMQDMPFEKATSFVPYYAVSEGLYNWLDASLESGLVTDGIYFGYGSTEDDGAENAFTSSIFLSAENGSLAFADGWPSLEGLKADIHIQNGELDIQTESASIAGTQLNGLSAVLPEDDLNEGLPLKAVAQVSANEAELEYWLKSSPISNQTRDVAEQLEIEGQVAVDIALDIPVSTDGDVMYDIRAHLSDNKITHLPSELPFTKVDGELVVSSLEGIKAENVRSQLLGREAKLSITQEGKPVVVDKEWVYEGGHALFQKDVTQQDIVLRLETNTALDNLLEHYDFKLIPGLTGSLDVAAELLLPAHPDLYPSLNIHSDTKGLERAWPEPFAKVENEQEAFSLTMSIQPEQLAIQARIESPKAPLVESDLLFVETTFKNGDVRIGGVDTLAFPERGLVLNGALEEMELGPWVAFIDQYASRFDSAGQPSLLRQINLDVRALDTYGYVFEDVQSSILPFENTWKVNLTGSSIEGVIELASDNKPLSLDLKKVVFPVVHDDGSNEVKEQDPVNPSQLPALNFKTESLVYDGRDLGAWSARLEPYDEGAYLRELKGELARNHFDGQLNWKLVEGVESSILTMGVAGRDIDKIIRGFGWARTLDSKKLNADLALVWPGSPADFDMGSLSGSVNMKLEEGILNTSDSTTGFLRVFGILNAETILRRLKLDFSDLYKSGLSYDKLTLSASIDNGLLSLNDALLIEGPSSDYEISGTTDLAKQTLDMEMRVELPISQNVPLAALMLGAPQIGGAVWLVDKILGEPLADITTARYRVSGTWEDPKLDLKEAANAGRKSRLN